MVEQGPVGAFYLLREASTCFGSEACIGHLQEMECTNTSPKTMEDYMKKSAQFGYGRTGSCWCISSPRGGLNMLRLRSMCLPPPGHGMQQHKSKNHRRLYEKECPVRLWQNKVMLVDFISSGWPQHASAPKHVLTTSRTWNAPSEVEKPSKII
jgi:hypothetical protein